MKTKMTLKYTYDFENTHDFEIYIPQQFHNNSTTEKQ